MSQQDAVFAFLETKLWIACTVCEVALCVLLIKWGLLGRYPCLFGLAFVNAVRDIGLSAALATSSQSYGNAWPATLPILMSVQIATVLEAYTKLTSQYPGLGSFASKLLAATVTMLTITTCISVAWDFHHFSQSIQQAILFFYRYFAFVLAGCLAIPSLILSRFPKPDKRPATNIRIHLWLLVSYFSVYMISSLSVNLLGTQETTIVEINVVMLLALCGLYGTWALILMPAGETGLPWPQLRPDLVKLIDVRADVALERGKKISRSGPA
ncbi:MAG: hypothetical protein ACR2JB_17705 [Bryobacteraceae bacterium]